MDTEVSTTTDSQKLDDPDVNSNGDMVTSSTSDVSTDHPDDDDSSEVSSSDAKPLRQVFKMPVLTGPRPGKQKALKTGVKPLAECTDLPLPSTATDDDSEKEPQSSPYSKPMPANVPYEEPPWSGVPDRAYSFQVLKSGVIVQTINLDKPFTVVGRKEDCDIVMDHPSISRYHAVVQYRLVPGEQVKSGFYLYDLDSTHGTFVNKNQVRPRSYTRINVGHIVKFGGSTRGYILEGPEEDQEEECSLTVTEIKALRKRQEEEMKRLEAEEKAKQEAAKAKQEKEGVDWGLGEDAEEDACAENPFALSTANEDLYIDDPKKTLRGWFEREGYDLQYNVEEKGYSHFVCTVELPIDSPTGEPVVAEASVKGKKKEAVVACALEACRILDRFGELRKSHHEGRKRKQKNWEENDFYDSDEDTFLDRTGTIEKKREMRKKLTKKEEEVDTYDTLVEKLKGVEGEIIQVQQKLETSKQAAKDAETGAEDSLDAFMSSLKSQTLQDKAQRSKLRQQLATLLQERSRLAKLANIAKPAGLPPLTSTLLKYQSREAAGNTKKVVLPMTGSMKGHPSRKKKPVTATVVQPMPSVPQLADGEEEEDEEEDEEKPQEQREKQQQSCLGVQAAQAEDVEAEMKEAQPRVIGPTRPTGDILAFIRQKGESTSQDDAKKKAKSASTKLDCIESNEDYVGWLPPEGQTGDGKTYLNTKYGY